MNVFEPLAKEPKLALIAAAMAVAARGQRAAAGCGSPRMQAAVRPANPRRWRAADTGMQTLEQYLQDKTMRVSKLVGMEVQSRSGDSLGEVQDIARNAAPGQNMQLIVTLGGILGDDQKLIAIPFDEIQITADGDELHANRTREQLAGLPAVTLDATHRRRSPTEPRCCTVAALQARRDCSRARERPLRRPGGHGIAARATRRRSRGRRGPRQRRRQRRRSRRHRHVDGGRR